MAMVAATMTTTATAATTTSVGASAQELYAVTAASESATRSTGPAMVAPECQPKVQLQASFTHLSMCTADGWYIQM
ncbi:Os06g0470500 [Oryza sativa Japonica Group]|uniref:Os06g0470500 protein n=1 Tax=Oryza sativa subsp. japonica TaxID=39947 RepID=A0A0N7KM38_ORYSJ|nr:Os06g0470500 [Oryza sativa Japonica Group]